MNTPDFVVARGVLSNASAETAPDAGLLRSAAAFFTVETMLSPSSSITHAKARTIQKIHDRGRTMTFDTQRYIGASFAILMCVAVLLIAWAAHGGEIADCAHDRFMEAYLSKQTVTIEDVEKRADVALQVCLPPRPTDAERDEFDGGIDQAVVEIVEEITSKKGDSQ